MFQQTLNADLRRILEVFEAHASQVNIETNLAHAAAVAFIFGELVQRNLVDPTHVGSILRGLFPILYWQPEFVVTSDQHLHAAFHFLSIPCFMVLEPQGYNINQWTSEFLTLIRSITTVETTSEAVRTSFTILLLRFVSMRWPKIKVTPELVHALLDFGTLPMIRIAGILTSAMPHQGSFIPTIFTRFTQMIQASSTHETAQAILCFFANYHVESQPPTQQAVLEFLLSFEGARETDEGLAHLIHAIRHLEAFGLPCFQELIRNAAGPKSILAIIECTIQLRRTASANALKPIYEPYHQLDTWGPIFENDRIREHFLETLNSVNLRQASRETEQLAMSFWGLFGSLVPLLPQEQTAWLMECAIEVLRRRYDTPSIWEAVLLFLDRVIESNAEIVIDQFVPISFDFALAPAFNPARAEWYQVVFRVLRLHCRLYAAKRKYREFSQGVVFSLGTLGIDEESADSYLHIIEKDLREANADLCRYAFMLMVVKNGRSWM
jgi:hypothetical protein